MSQGFHAQPPWLQRPAPDPRGRCLGTNLPFDPIARGACITFSRFAFISSPLRGCGPPSFGSALLCRFRSALAVSSPLSGVFAFCFPPCRPSAPFGRIGSALRLRLGGSCALRDVGPSGCRPEASGPHFYNSVPQAVGVALCAPSPPVVFLLGLRPRPPTTPCDGNIKIKITAGCIFGVYAALRQHDFGV